MPDRSRLSNYSWTEKKLKKPEMHRLGGNINKVEVAKLEAKKGEADVWTFGI